MLPPKQPIHTRIVLSTLLIATLPFVSKANAADVNWGTPTQISGSSDVSTTGNLIGAFNVGDTGVPSATVNGVNFQSFAAPGGLNAGAVSGGVTFSMAPGGGGVFNSNTSGASTMTPFTSLPPGYQTLLSSYVIPLFSPVNLAMSGLIVGAQYQFQFWSNVSSDNNSYTITANGGTMSINVHSNDGHADGGLGEWVAGSFTADAATQNIGFIGDGDGGFLNGFQLRQIVQVGVPETGSTFVFLVFALGGLAVLQRKIRRTT